MDCINQGESGQNGRSAQVVDKLYHLLQVFDEMPYTYPNLAALEMLTHMLTLYTQ